jgi:hypothetical protein
MPRVMTAPRDVLYSMTGWSAGAWDDGAIPGVSWDQRPLRARLPAWAGR